MKKLFLLVMCFFLVAVFAQAGASGKSGKQENPRQAGKSSIYFYDVECQSNPNPDCIVCGPCSGYGTFVIDTAKKTFNFIGHDYTPLQNVHVKIGSLGFIAKGKVTKSGNVHIQGEWEDNIVPEPESVGHSYYYYDPAYGFMGQSLAGYVAHLKIRYSKDGGTTWHTTEKETGDISLGETYKITVAQFTDSTHVINKGDLIQLKARVVWGDDTWTSTINTYVPDADPMYCWPWTLLHGTTWDAWIEYYNDTCQPCLTGDCSNYWYIWGEDIW